MNRTKTKNGKPRSHTPKATITESRLHWRTLTWDKVKLLLQHHLKISPKGEQLNMARALGIESSQIHRYSCPVCEHDQEPSFSVGMAIFAYIIAHHHRPTINLN